MPGHVKLQARIRGTDGVWFVADEIEGLTLDRPGSVRLYKPRDVGERFWTRTSRRNLTSGVTIPDGVNLATAVSARLLVRTWNGVDGAAEPGHGKRAGHGRGQGTEEQEPSYCGLAVGQIGQYTVVGFDATGKILWDYALPSGEYEHQLPRIQSVSLPGTDVHWQIAAADGSIHWLTATGDLVDQFRVGETLTGLTISQNGDTTLLWVATKTQLTAWAVNSHPNPSPEQ